jgi:hypothetical protein
MIQTLSTKAKLGLLGGLALSAVACASAPPPGPEIGSSAGEGRYATDYSKSLEGDVNGFGENESALAKTEAEFAEYPGQLENAPWDKVADIIERAAEAGRSEHYVEGTREVEGAKQFFDAEGEEITKKVGGAAQYAVKQSGCEADVWGAVSTSMKKGVEERLRERQRSFNDAHLLIDRHREELGKENATKLEDQVDEVSFGAYIAHVEMVEQKLRVMRMLEEAGDVKNTMEAFIEEEQAFQAESGRKEAEIEASKKRVQAMEESRASVDAAQKQAEELSKALEERLTEAQTKYDDAVEKLVESYRAKGK